MESQGSVNSVLERAFGRKGSRRLRGRLLGRTHLLPDFIIIGAARSGTTHLLGQLNAHPNVIEGPAETHFFDTHRYTYGLGWYRLRFPANKQRREAYRTGLHPVLTGESSPSYLAHPNAPARVARGVPGAKLLVLLRDPATRAASHWAWCLRQCGETRSFREAVEAEIGAPGDTAGIHVPLDKRVNDPLVVRRGIYQPQLERWRTHFPDDQLMVIQSERWFRDPPGVMAEVCDFLEIPHREELPRVMRNRNKPHEPFDEDVLAHLHDFYRPYNEELADYLDMPLDWNDTQDA
ncbi:MAG: sulfotransferase domain-containing protein [Chloroflexota bacterium]|nr:sulfotransferase domain-containing protein [Chloroflexota bacterium]